MICLLNMYISAFTRSSDSVVEGNELSLKAGVGIAIRAAACDEGEGVVKREVSHGKEVGYHDRGGARGACGSRSLATRRSVVRRAAFRRDAAILCVARFTVHETAASVAQRVAHEGGRLLEVRVQCVLSVVQRGDLEARGDGGPALHRARNAAPREAFAVARAQIKDGSDSTSPQQIRVGRGAPRSEEQSGDNLVQVGAFVVLGRRQRRRNLFACSTYSFQNNTTPSYEVFAFEPRKIVVRGARTESLVCVTAPHAILPEQHHSTLRGIRIRTPKDRRARGSNRVVRRAAQQRRSDGQRLRAHARNRRSEISALARRLRFSAA